MLVVNVYITSFRNPGAIITPDPVPLRNETWSPLILISSDGFRWDYLGRVPTPNLDRLIANGVRAHSLKPSFPSKTFPNHYTLVTGLYPANHGIIDNTIYDPGTSAVCHISQIVNYDCRSLSSLVYWVLLFFCSLTSVLQSSTRSFVCRTRQPCAMLAGGAVNLSG